MLGLFDSGSGGLNTARYIKRHAPRVDLIYLIDRERAPYGIKTEQEITEITCDNIKRLSDMGAARVLIACCTASTVYKNLPDGLKTIAIPIIPEIARRAKNSTRSGRIGVIATNRTVSAHAFKKEMAEYTVYEYALPELVTMIDGGLSDKTASGDDVIRLEKMLAPVLNKNIDTLVLGCTHFPSLYKTVKKIAKPYGVRRVIDSARVGAELLNKESRKLNKKNKRAVRKDGKGDIKWQTTDAEESMTR